MKTQDSPATAPQPAQPLLEVKGAVKTFGQHTAVNGINFEVFPGEVLALLGPNGAGKTTTIEMCEGFQRPDEGNISLFGLDPYRNSDAVRSRIGVMLQGGGAYPGIRVGEMLQLVASYSQDPLDFEWLLELVGLQRHRKTTYRRLSGGQQQRLALACALVNRPELVFLDEPTAGLDAQSRHAVWDIISALKRDGVGVILTTHLLDEAEALSDRVVIIDEGKVVASGSPQELTSNRGTAGASHSFRINVAEELDQEGFRASLAQHSAQNSTQVSVRKVGARTYAIEGIPASSEGILQLAQAAHACGAFITALDSSEQSLEDVFLALTGREMRS